MACGWLVSPLLWLAGLDIDWRYSPVLSVGISIVFKDHWQVPYTALTTGELTVVGDVQKGTVEESPSGLSVQANCLLLPAILGCYQASQSVQLIWHDNILLVKVRKKEKLVSPKHSPNIWILQIGTMSNKHHRAISICRQSVFTL